MHFFILLAQYLNKFLFLFFWILLNFS
jgi:hypothetical protein